MVILKNKVVVQNSSNYRGIKLKSLMVKIWQRVVEARLRAEVMISEFFFINS